MTSNPQRRYRSALSFTAAAVAAIGLASWPLASTGGSPAPGLAALPSHLGKGDFLVATRELRDPRFARTVVLLLEHGPGGSLGLIVNRPTTTKLAELLPETEGLADRQDTVYVGGPVLPGAMLILVRSDSAPAESQQVVEGVYYSGSRELLAELSAAATTARPSASTPGMRAGPRGSSSGR